MKEKGTPGRPNKIKDPDHMEELFKQFVIEKKADTITVVDFVGKDATRVEKPFQRPLTLEGFSVWLRENGIIQNVHDYFCNTNGKYTRFSNICRAIKEKIRNDQIEGGMAGIYNASITQRLNGLTDKQEVKQEHSGTINQVITGMQIIDSASEKTHEK